MSWRISFLSTTTYPGAKSMARALKSERPDMPIIVGGVFATMNQDRMLKDCPQIDCVGVGEGEELLPGLPGSPGRSGRRGRPGLAKRPEHRGQHHRARIMRDLDQFPYPDRTTLPIDYIESLPLDVPAVLSLEKFCTIQTSRGCPYTCIYCDIPALTEWQMALPFARNMCWERCSSSTTWATARST